MRDESEHLAPHIFAVDRMNVEPVEERRRRFDPFFLVIHRADPAVEECRRRGLAEIMRHCAEHDDELVGAVEVVDARARLVDHLERVHPHVSFRMPFGLLHAAHERLQLWKQLIHDAQLERQRESNRWPPRAEQQLFDLPPDAFRRQIVEADRAAQRLRGFVERHLEPRGELNRPQHAQAVVAERRRDRPHEEFCARCLRAR